MYEIVAFCRRARHPVPGPRLGGELARSASASASPRSIRCAWACCSSASCRASAPSRPTSISTSSTSAAKKSSSTSTSATAAITPRWSRNVIRYRPRSAVRDVGKALGIPRDRARSRREACSSMYGARRATTRSRTPGSIRQAPRASSTSLRLCRRDPRVPAPPLDPSRAASCSATSRSHDIVPIENATMPGRTVIQWDKDDLEDLGAVQGRPARPRRAHQLHLGFDLLREHRGIELVDGDDPRRGRRRPTT